jgi:hypothetical protein
MSFAGAAWNDRPVIQVLLNILPFNHHPSDTTLRAMAARHLGAFKKAVHGLERYYRSELPVSPASHQPSSYEQIFPYQTDFTSLVDSTTTDIEYSSQVPDKLVFFGRLPNNRPVCIKFTRRYSKEAHHFCSSIRAAPDLLGFQPIAGGWYMVVMAQTEPNYVELFNLSGKAIKVHILEKVRSILTELHDGNFVHGDIRDTNIMVQENGKDVSIMLVDFDWAGKIGDVRYPMNVYRGDRLWRPEGACDGELITTGHDIEMLDYLYHH